MRTRSRVPDYYNLSRTTQNTGDERRSPRQACQCASHRPRQSCIFDDERQRRAPGRVDSRRMTSRAMHLADAVVPSVPTPAADAQWAPLPQLMLPSRTADTAPPNTEPNINRPVFDNVIRRRTDAPMPLIDVTCIQWLYALIHMLHGFTRWQINANARSTYTYEMILSVHCAALQLFSRTSLRYVRVFAIANPSVCRL